MKINVFYYTKEQEDLVKKRFNRKDACEYRQMRAPKGFGKKKAELVEELRELDLSCSFLTILSSARNEYQENLFNNYLKKRLVVLDELDSFLK